MNLAFHEEMVRLLRAGRRVGIATLVHRQGSAPRAFGTKMIVSDAGETVFSIGGGAFEALVIEDAREAIRAGRGFEKEYRFAESGEGATGMVCGGAARILFEVVVPPDALFVFGAGHVGRELVHVGIRLGFLVTVVDDRSRFLDPGRFPDGVRRVEVQHDFGGDLPEVPPGAYVAIVTRCHRTDLAVIRHVCGGRAAYVGVIGSRRKVATLRARAEAMGTPREALDEIRGPIGLAIGAQTPEEIAISIAAELVAVRNLGADAVRVASARHVPRGVRVLPTPIPGTRSH
jgi:xanthine dehydrogenase accessory factor